MNRCVLLLWARAPPYGLGPPQVAMSVACSFASGRRDVREVRFSIFQSPLVSAPLPLVFASRPVVFCVDVVPNPFPSLCTFVGVSDGSTSCCPSIWLNPYEGLGPPSAFSLRAYKSYLSKRCDLEFLCRPLVGRSLMCNCNSEYCHAFALSEACFVYFGPSTDTTVDDEPQSFLEPVPTPSACPRPLPVPDQYHDLVQFVRSSPSRLFWAPFDSVSSITKVFDESEWLCLNSSQYGGLSNLSDPSLLSVIISLVLEGSFGFVYLHVHQLSSPPMNPDVFGEVVSIVSLSLKLAIAQRRGGGHWFFLLPCPPEGPRPEGFSQFMSRYALAKGFINLCGYGAPARAPVKFWASLEACKSLVAPCQHSHSQNVTNVEAQVLVWPALVRAVAVIAESIKAVPRGTGSSKHLAGVTLKSPDQDYVEWALQSGFIPSGRRSAMSIAFRLASGVQAPGRAFPTIMPEGLGPSEHLEIALSLTHPFLWPVPLSPACRIALKKQLSGIKGVSALRKELSLLVTKLGKLLSSENQSLQAHAHKFVRPVSQSRNIPLLRELSVITAFKDPELWAQYMHGIPMLGMAYPSLSLPLRFTPPLSVLLRTLSGPALIVIPQF